MRSEYQQIRRRTNRVNIKITFLSWILEFLSGIFVILARVLKYKSIIHWMYLVDLCLVFVIIPCTYVLNREVTKQIIVFGNWYQGVRSIIFSNALQSSQSNQVNPIVENNRDHPRDPGSEPSAIKVQYRSKPKIYKRISSKNNNGSQKPSSSGTNSPIQQPAMFINISKLQENFRNRVENDRKLRNNES